MVYAFSVLYRILLWKYTVVYPFSGRWSLGCCQAFANLTLIARSICRVCGVKMKRFSGVHVGVKLLGCRVCSVSQNNVKLFSKVVLMIYTTNRI